MQVDQFAAAYLAQRGEVGRQLCQWHVVQPEPVLTAGFLAVSVIEGLADQFAVWIIQVGGCTRQRLASHHVSALDDSLA